jgi:hypothetical protein
MGFYYLLFIFFLFAYFMSKLSTFVPRMVIYKITAALLSRIMKSEVLRPLQYQVHRAAVARNHKWVA